jgi:hypothetical protein
MDAFEHAEDGAEMVIARHRLPCGNLRTQLHRIIKRAGLTVWPKPFHNLRSSRQTQLAEDYPIHVVCAWLGNSPAIALGHYLQVRDSDYARAIRSEGAAPARAAGDVAASGAAESVAGVPGAGADGRDVGQRTAT